MTLDLTITSLRERYASGDLKPSRLIESLIAARRSFDSHHIWISHVGDDALRARARELDGIDPAALPLYGVPFAIKDNIDFATLPTTAACPAFAYQPAASATVVQALIDAGAIALGKTNLDQFATGLVGTRSPHGACRNSFDPEYVSGGSSSGSAVAVALGLASFALGTDTAGSGRVPAAFNNLIGYKPTLGLLSMRGVVPACRTLDTVSIFALTAEDADRVRAVAARVDAGDPWSRPLPRASKRGWAGSPFTFGVPRDAQLEFFGNEAYSTLFAKAAARLETLGGKSREVDIAPLLETARLLYEGPWVAERYLATESLLASNPEAMLPVTRGIIQGGAAPRALDAFRSQYRLQALRRSAAPLWEACDLLLLPTAGTHYRIAEVESEPVALNSNLGRYTNFVNLMDLAAVAVPAGFTPAGLPFGISLIAPAGSDADLLSLAGRAHRAAVTTLGASRLPLPPAPPASPVTDGLVDVMVCGAHLSGLPLNPQLLERGARCIATTRTAPIYRFYALPGGPPFRPGLVQVPEGGVAIDVEVWRMPVEHFGSFVAGIPAPLGIGKVRLEDGSQVSGFLCESLAVAGAEDISALGGWRQYLRRKSAG
jgi:allophanate hydrolase